MSSPLSMSTTSKMPIKCTYLTRSLSIPRQPSNNPKSRFLSAIKTSNSNYRIILNKLLSMHEYEKFVVYSSRFIDRNVLEGKQRLSRSHEIKEIGMKLLSDGAYVKHLAELSPNPIQVINCFKKCVSVNRKIMRQYEGRLRLRMDLNQENIDKEQNHEHMRQSQKRFTGLYTPQKPINNPPSPQKIQFAEYLSSLSKSKQQRYRQMLKRQISLSEQKRDDGGRRRKERNVVNIAQLNTAQLSQVEKEMFLKFPSLRYYARNINPDNFLEIRVLGTLRGFEIVKIGVEYEDVELIDCTSPWKPNRPSITVYDFGIILRPTHCAALQTQASLAQDDQVRVLVRNG